MDIIFGHKATFSITGERELSDVFHDGRSHYFDDGGVETSGNVLVLVYDKRKKYYQLKGD